MRPSVGFTAVPVVEILWGGSAVALLFVHNLGVEVAIWSVGVMLMSSDEVLKERKGEAIQICGFMNDGLWLMKPI